MTYAECWGRWRIAWRFLKKRLLNTGLELIFSIGYIILLALWPLVALIVWHEERKDAAAERRKKARQLALESLTSRMQSHTGTQVEGTE